MPHQDPSTDSTDLSEKQLKLATWYVGHKVLLKRILIGFLIVFSVVFLGYGLYGIINYYFIEGPKFIETTKELSSPIDYSAARARLQPQGLGAGAVSVLSSGKEKYDLVIKISNPNSNWLVNFDYNFVIDGQPLPAQKGFILPGEEKFLLALSVESKVKPRQASLEISSFNWQRVDAREISDYVAWRDERLNFAMEEVKFLPAVIRDKIAVSRVSFKAKNLTVYSFWNVGFYIFLYRGSSLAGVNYVTLGEFVSGQTRPVEVSWFEPLPSVTQVKVIPEVNIFDKNVYMPVE